MAAGYTGRGAGRLVGPWTERTYRAICGRFAAGTTGLPALDATVVILYASQGLDNAHVNKLIEIAASASGSA